MTTDSLQDLTRESGAATAFRDSVSQALESGDPSKILGAVRDRATAVGPADAARLWLSAADRWTSDSESRRLALREAAVAASGDDALFEFLSRAFAGAGDADGNEAILLARIASAPTSIDARVALANFYIGVNRSSDAAETARELAALSPQGGAAALQLLDSLQAHLQQTAANELVLSAARSAGDDRRVLTALEARFRAEPNESGRVAELADELAKHCLKVTGDPEAAFSTIDDAWARAPGEHPAIYHSAEDIAAPAEHPALIGRLAEFAGELERWTEVVRWQRWLSEREERPYRKAERLLVAADTLAVRLAETDEALTLYLAAAELDAASAEAVDQRLLALERNTEGAARAAVREARASLLKDKGNFTELHDVLMHQVAEADEDSRPSRLVELADLQLDKLGRPDLAVISLSEALGSTKAQPDTVSGVVSRLDGLLGVDQSAERAAAALAAYHRANDNQAGLATALEVLAQRASSADDRSQYFSELSAAREALGEMEAAADALTQAHVADPSAGHQTKLRTLLCDVGRYDDALGLIQRELDAADGEAKESLLNAQAAISVKAGNAGRAARIWFELGDAGKSGFDELVSGEGGEATAREAAASYATEDRPADAAALLWSASAAIGLKRKEAVLLGCLAAETAPLDAKQTARLLTAANRQDEETQVAVHRAILVHPKDVQTERASRLALGELLATSDASAAEGYLRAIIEAEPDNQQALDRLLEIVSKSGDAGQRVQVLEHRLEHLTLSEHEAVDHLSKIVDLYVDELGRPDLGFTFARSILQFDPLHERSLALVEENTTGDLGLRYEVLVEGVEELTGETLATRHRQLAELAMQLGADPRAAAHLISAAGIEAVDAKERVTDLRKAAELHFKSGDAAGVLESFGLETPLLTDERGPRAEEVIDRLSELGVSHGYAAANLALADWDSPEPGVLDRHAQLARRNDDVGAAVASLLKWIEVDGDRVPLDRRAQLALDAFQADPEADEAWEYCADALARDPGHIDLVMKVEELRGDGGRIVALSDRLEVLAEDRETDEKLAILYRAAELVAPEDESKAEGIWRSVLDLAPGETRAMDLLRGALRERGDNVGETELIRERLNLVDGDERLGLLKEIAELANSDEDAEASHRAVLEESPDSRESRSALADLLERTGRFDEAIATLAEYDEGTPSDRRATLGRIAAIAADKLADSERAASAFEAMVEIDPTDDATLQKLAKIYEEGEKWPELSSTLERLAGLEDNDDRKARLYERLATVREDRLEDAAGAAAAREHVVALEPANIAALQEVARLHEAAEDWDKYVDALDRIAEAANIPGLRQEILMRAAPVLLEKLERPGDSLILFEQALSQGAPAQENTVELMRTAAEKTGDWARWCNAVRLIANAEEDPTKRTELEIEIADTLVERLEDPKSAVAWLAESVAREPRLGPTLTRVEEIADAHDLQSDLVETYKRLTAQNGDDPDTIWHALSRSRMLAEKIGHPDTAFGIMCRAAETPELAERSGEELERLAKEYGLWNQYVDFLGDGDESTAVERSVRQAEIQSTELKDWESAFETLMAAFQDAPFDERIQTPLYTLAEENSAWPFVAKLLELLQEDASDDEKARYLTEMASVYGDRLGNHSDAFAQQLRAWQLSPRDEALGNALRSRAESAERLVDLLAAYEWLTKQPGTSEEVAAAFDQAAALSLEQGLADRAVALYARRAIAQPTELDTVLTTANEALREHEGATFDLAQTIAEEADGVVATRALVFVAGLAGATNPTEQVTLLRRAVQVASTPGDVRPALLAALREGENREELAKELETRLTENIEDDERRAVTEELRDLYRDHLGDPERAARMGRRLMDLSPESDAARHDYEAQLRDLERWPELVEHLVRRADSADATEEATKLRLEAAGIAEEYLDDPRRAVRIADAVLAADEGSIQALELRARALAGLGRWKEHIDSLERLVAVSEPEAAARVYAQAADVYEHQLAYSDRALKMWEAAGEADPTYGKAFAQQARLAAETGDADLSFQKWTLACEKLEGTELASGLVSLAQAAQLSGAEADVVAILRRATEVDPRNALARSAYEDALLDAGDVDAIMRLLDAELESALPEEKAHIYLRRAAIQFFDQQKEADALKSIEAASEADGGRPAASLKGDIHLVAGRWEECVAAYRVALGDDDTLDPRTLAPRALLPGEDPNRHAATTIFLFRAGYASEAAGRYSDAQDFYGSANLDDDTFAPASVGLARLAVRQGNLDGASIYIADYRQSGPGNPELDAEIAELEKRLPR